MNASARPRISGHTYTFGNISLKVLSLIGKDRWLVLKTNTGDPSTFPEKVPMTTDKILEVIERDRAAGAAKDMNTVGTWQGERRGKVSNTSTRPLRFKFVIPVRFRDSA